MLLLAALAQSQPAPPEEPTLTPSDVMAESTALKLGAAARQLAATAELVAGEGRIGRLSALRSDADEVVRRAEMLVRLTAPPEEEEGKPSPTGRDRGQTPPSRTPGPNPPSR